MIRIKTIIALTKKEILSHLNTPSVSIGFIVFVFVWQFLFFRNAFLIGEASVRILFDYLPWMLLIFSSAVTMGVFSQEKNDGTIELLLTHPVKELEVVISKFLGSLFLIVVSLFFSFPIAIAFSRFGVFDWGAFFAQFFSAIFLAGCFISIGVFFSSLLTSSIASLLATSAASFFLLIVGSEFITANVPLAIVPILERLSLSSHFVSMSRGVIDVRDVWYFLSFIIIFLSLTFLFLIKQKFGNRRDYYIRYQIGIILFIGIAVVSNVLGSRIPGRFDITSDKKYTISPSTRKILGDLSDIVTITFYASSRLPSQLTPIVRDVRDLLRDYQQYGKGNISVVYKDPSNNSQISSEASSRGLREIQFNVIGQEEFQIKTGFVGIVLSYGGKHESIPYIQNTGDLEYQLTSLIAKLTTKEKKKVSFLSGHGEKNPSVDYPLFYDELQKQFVVESITLNDDNPEISSDSAVIVIAGPSKEIDQKHRVAITNFLKKGRSALFLIDAFEINPQMLTASVNKNSFGDFLQDFGISVNQNIGYDLRSNETIRMGQGFINLLLPYPFWIRAIPSQSSFVSRINGVSLPWPASITVNEEKIASQGLKFERLLKTSPYANVQTENISLNPNTASFSDENLSEQTLAVLLSGPQQSSEKFSGKIIVVGDSDFLTDQFIQNAPQNLSFGIAILSYLAQQDSLADIRVKQSEPSRLLFRNALEPAIIKYGNLIAAVILPSGFILVRQLRRRSLRHKKYRL
ncbi:MAG: Gldg family protein [Patescibacteria group bacterium]|nr:Gldg family protein [Patescibacteria group bacterium]